MNANDLNKLTTSQMARFAAKGYLRFDGVVPEKINASFLDDICSASLTPSSVKDHYAQIKRSSVIPLVSPGTPLTEAYPEQSALQALLSLPAVAGAVESLVGLDCVVDHHFLHVTFPPTYFNRPQRSQPTHQDSTIDPRQAFDIQLLYFPHEVTVDMGGTRFLPGSHFRVVSEEALARYQNIRGQQHVVCPAGTVMLFHMGLWHGAGLNQSDRLRYMFKIRLCPTKRQLRLCDDSAPISTQPRPIFWDSGNQAEDLNSILTTPEPWFEADTSRLEYINRIRFWRYISGDQQFDADYWVTRVENDYDG